MSGAAVESCSTVSESARPLPSRSAVGYADGSAKLGRVGGPAAPHLNAHKNSTSRRL